MYKFIIMLMFCLATGRTSGKSLFDSKANPEYDLQADGSRSYSNYWPGSEYDSSAQIRNKHYAPRFGPHARRDVQPGFGGPPGHHFQQSSEEYDDDFPQHAHQYQHRHPSGRGKKNGHHGHRGHHGHPHDAPRRFPPSPVYDKDFINPWAPISSQPFTVQQPPWTTPVVYLPPNPTTRTTTSTTTPAPISTTTTEYQYDIDVRFGGI